MAEIDLGSEGHISSGKDRRKERHKGSEQNRPIQTHNTHTSHTTKEVDYLTVTRGRFHDRQKSWTNDQERKVLKG